MALVDEASEGRTSNSSWLLFEFADQLFALPAANVSTVLARPRLVSMPFAVPMLLGIANVLGEVVMVFDAALWRGLSSHGDAKDLIVIEVDNDKVGLLVDRVHRVVLLENQEVLAGGEATTSCDGRDVRLLAIGPRSFPPAPYAYPAAGTELSFSADAASLRQSRRESAGARRRVLAFASGMHSCALPIEIVTRIRGAVGDGEPRVETAAVAAQTVSLAAMMGAREPILETDAIDLVLDGRALSVSVERIAGLVPADDADVQGAADFLDRLRRHLDPRNDRGPASPCEAGNPSS